MKYLKNSSPGVRRRTMNASKKLRKIVRKLSRNEPLAPREHELYEAYKEDFDALATPIIPPGDEDDENEENDKEPSPSEMARWNDNPERPQNPWAVCASMAKQYKWSKEKQES
jgi:hypothetical protein